MAGSGWRESPVAAEPTEPGGRRRGGLLIFLEVLKANGGRAELQLEFIDTEADRCTRIARAEF